MATGQLLKSFQSFYTSLEKLIEEWNMIHVRISVVAFASHADGSYARSCTTFIYNMQDEVMVLMGTSANILERLRMLTGNDDNYGSLLDDDDAFYQYEIKDRLVSNSYKTLTDLVKEDVAGAVVALEQVGDSMDKILRSARHAVQQRCRGMDTYYMKRSKGPIPSVEACVDGIERIVSMYQRETTLCRIAGCDLLPAVSLMSGCIQGNEQQLLLSSVVERLRDVLRTRCCVDAKVTKTLIYIVKATVEDERML